MKHVSSLVKDYWQIVTTAKDDEQFEEAIIASKAMKLDGGGNSTFI
jgi:hypothetical protein